MNCPKCGERVKVTDSKHADSYHSVHYNCKFKTVVQELVGWYTPDWVYRRRKCVNRKCKFAFDTIEVPCEDLDKMFDEKSKNRNN
jgi:hypothetical protein